MAAAKDAATERDVTLDVVAALDMFTGSMGSDETVIESVETDESDDRCTIKMTLDNGQVFALRVREERS